jgi:Ser/Thr protein kinase RdoA (MazF antagonist)
VPVETAQIAEQVEKHFGLEIGGVDSVKSKSNSLVYRLQTESRCVFLRLYVGSFSNDRVAEEAALLEYLGEREFNAPRLVKTAAGGSVLQCAIDGDLVCGYLTEEVPIDRAGIDVEDDAHLRLAAQKLAEFHTITGTLGRNFTAVSWNLPWMVDRNLRTLEPSFAKRRGDYATISEWFAQGSAGVSQRWRKAEGTWGIIHGDWHSTNLILGAGGDLWFLDFESFGNGWRISDVVYLLGDAVREDGPMELERLRHRYGVFMEAYSRRGPHIGDASELPVFWLTVQVLLQLGRQIREARQSGLDASREESLIDAFVEKIDLLRAARP